jgi:hypothetical protein
MTKKGGKVARFDRGLIQRMHETQDGFLKGDGYVTRTGVFTYVNADGSLRKELRHPSDVLTLESMESMKMIPLTNGHPARLVTPDTAKQVQVGHVGENIRPDGELVLASVMITDGDTIQSVLAGKQQLSLGYETDLMEEAGEYEGQRYDFRQTNIRYNHLALVDTARAGDKARLKLDEADAIEIEDRKDGKPPKHQQKERRMKTYTIDGIDYEAAPEVINHVKGLQRKLTGTEQRADTLEKEKDDQKTRADKAEAERDEARDKLKKHEDGMPDTIKNAVSARVDLIESARPFLDDEAKKKLDGMTDREIKEAVVQTKYPDAKFDGKDDAYVDARFDSVVEDGADDGNGGSDDSTGSQRKDAGKGAHGGKGNRGDAASAQEKMMERMRKAHEDKKDQ